TIKAIINIFEECGLKVILAAPTGRAARRMSETSGKEAKTIHRLLEYGFTGQGWEFQRNEKNPLKADVLIVDEVSMVDLLLMYNLLKALPSSCKLILVGDMDQLPSVGAGNVLRELIKSEVIPVVTLDIIFRQAQESLIIVNAHRINRGKLPFMNNRDKDFFFLQEEDPEKIIKMILDLCSFRIPEYLKVRPLEDIQVITPMRKTLLGVENLNRVLQEALNPPLKNKNKKEVNSGGEVFRPGDKVMQVKNNYQKEVYNGDIGIINEIDSEDGEITVIFSDFDDCREVNYNYNELDELTLSYAISVHKSQGSEYPVIVMPVVTQHYILLQRNLIYTAVTRARQMVVVVGTKKAMAIALKNNRVEERYTLLSERLREE
ncbi:MAG: ATP-dependent RecD-like DNA helicase, partial [Firmicutes bacterium HGW-Firmicutes-13]